MLEAAEFCTHQDVWPTWCFTAKPPLIWMDTTKKERPPVPSSSTNPDQGSGQTSYRTGGAKNPWVGSGCHLHIGTYNARSLGNEERLLELEYELNKIKWDVLGISEVRRKGEHCLRLSSGHVLFYSGNEQNNTGGVGILVHKRLTSNVQTLKAISDRVIYATIRITANITIKIIQIYAPTSSYDDDQVETLYEEISQGLTENRTKYTVVLGDFNAKIGSTNSESKYIGPFGLGTRNERGNMLANYLEKEQLYAMNTFFKKRPNKKWTWMSPDGKTKNEIDYVLTYHKHIIQDVDVLSSFATGSDHRLVRCKILINGKLERARKFSNKQKPLDVSSLKEHKEDYKKELTQQLTQGSSQLHENINEMNRRLTKLIKETAANHMTLKEQKKDKLTQKTKQLLEKRRELIRTNKRNTVEYAEINRAARRMAKQDIREYQEKRIEELIEQNRGLNIFRKENSHRREISKLIDQEGNTIEERPQILKVTETFYADLYGSKASEETLRRSREDNRRILNIGSEDLPDIEVEEIEKAINQIKNGKAAGEDDILPEMLKEGGLPLIKQLKTLFNKCLIEGEIPKDWETAIVILIYKKGDPSNLENYRPISLLSQIYKLFMRIITNRLDKKFENYQPKEQAGFRKRFSTVEHLHTVRQLIEKVTEYNVTIWMALVDFRKAFDTVEYWAIEKAMKNARVDQRYINILTKINEQSKLKVRLHEDTKEVKIKRGVRQGDIISPKLFTLVLEDIFKNLHWENRGLNISGERLNNLRFADDIALFAENEIELKEMLQELQTEAKKVGLEMNITKTKFMTNDQTTMIDAISIHGQQVERVESYVYLGQEVTIGKVNQELEVDRRIRLGWAAYGKMKQVFQSKLPLKLKTKVYNECILPVTTYGSETWVLTRKVVRKLQVHQRAIERKILGISLKDCKPNDWIRKRTEVHDIIERISSLKWNWAGHVARNMDNWSGKVTRWRPWGEKRSTGRPQQRWYDDIKKLAGLNWYQIAQNRDLWRNMREAYIQRIENG